MFVLQQIWNVLHLFIRDTRYGIHSFLRGDLSPIILFSSTLMVTPIDSLGSLQVFVNYNFLNTRFRAHKIGTRAGLHVGNCNRNKATCTLIIITWYDGRKCTKLVLNPWQLKTVSLFHACVLLLSCRLYYFSLHDDYSLFLYTMQSVYIAVLPFLINWNEKQCSESNIMTIDHETSSSSSDAVNLLLHTIIYLKTIKYLNIRLRQIH